MAFFPPSLSPNNEVKVTDGRHSAERGSNRFEAYTQEAVIYWPWLSWDQIDVTVGPDQRAIPRLTLIGNPPHKLYSVAADEIGSIIYVGSGLNAQAWEVIHNFDWMDPGSSVKKFAVAWLRLWTAAEPAPPPTAITGGVSWSTAVAVAYATPYQVELVGDVPHYFSFPTAAGQYRVVAKHEQSKPSALIQLFHSITTVPGLIGQAYTPTDALMNNSASDTGMNVSKTTNADQRTVDFTVYAL